MFPEIGEAAELQFKLESEDNRIQDRALRFSTSEVIISLDNFPHVRDKVARFCIILAGKLDSVDITRASFTMSQVLVR